MRGCAIFRWIAVPISCGHSHRELAERFNVQRPEIEDLPLPAVVSDEWVAWRNAARRGMEAAVVKAGLDKVPGRRPPTLHDLRHTFASMLIAQGLDAVFVSRQLGHSDPTVTLRVYVDMFDRARHTDRARGDGGSGRRAARWKRSGTERWRQAANRGTYGGADHAYSSRLTHRRR